MSEANGNAYRDAYDDVIRQCFDRSDQSSGRPSSDALTAVLLGGATMEQKKEVSDVLMRSSSFREDFKELLRGVESQQNLDPISDSGRTDIAIPDLSQYVDQMPKQSKGRQRSGPSLWERLQTLLSWRLYAPVAVAITAIALICISPDRVEHRSLRLVSAHIDEGLLRSKTTRALDRDDKPNIFNSADSAAILQLRSLIALAGKATTGLPTKYPQNLSGETGSLTVSIVEENGKALVATTFDVPIAANVPQDSISIWVLSKPENALYMVRPESDSISLLWMNDMGSVGYLAITYYEYSTGYRATGGYAFERKSL